MNRSFKMSDKNNNNRIVTKRVANSIDKSVKKRQKLAKVDEPIDPKDLDRTQSVIQTRSREKTKEKERNNRKNTEQADPQGTSGPDPTNADSAQINDMDGIQVAVNPADDQFESGSKPESEDEPIPKEQPPWGTPSHVFVQKGAI